MEIFLLCIILLILFPEQMGVLCGVILGLGVISAGFAVVAVFLLLVFNLANPY